MRIIDLIKISQRNLMRSKLRTILTILAVFIGTFSISITTGVGNGVNAYVNKELGNVGVENAFIVQPKSAVPNPLSNEVKEYNADSKTGIFNNILLTSNDISNIGNIKYVKKITPNYRLQIDYVTTAGNKKYQAAAQLYLEGLNVDMASGRTVDLNNTNEVTIPIRYTSYLGFPNAESAMNKQLTIGYKDSNNNRVEKSLTIVGIAQESVLGSSGIYVTPAMAKQIQSDQTAGVSSLADSYDSLIVEFDKNLPEEQANELKQLLLANNYTAQTIQDQIGTFSKIINGITVGLDVFGIVALLVATFGIVNTLLMAVNERTSEIGLMKALGANSRTVFGIFSIEAASIGFWGGLLGIGVSVAVGKITNQYASTHFLKDFVGFDLLTFPIASLITILLGIVLLAFLAGTLPSIKASKLDPIKALRYE